MKKESERKNLLLNTRDYINIGIFTAIMFVVIFGAGMLGFFGPVMMFPGLLIAVIINGTVFSLFTAKTSKMGAITISLTIIQILMTVTGHWAGGIPMGIICGLIADFIITKGPKNLNIRVPLAYCFFVIPIYTGPWIPIFINQEAYMADIAKKMSQEYANEMSKVINPGILVIFYIVMVVCAFVFGALGVKIGKRHFQRAGLV